MAKQLECSKNFGFQLFVACLAVVTSLSASALAQTKQETKEFLIKKANWKSTHKLDYSEDGLVHRLWFEDDVLVIRQTNPKHAKKDAKDETRYSETRVPLANLNPKRIEVLTFAEQGTKDCAVKFYVNPDRGNIKFRSSNVTPAKEWEDSKDAFYVPDERTAIQCVKALERLVTLSGGKAELFE